jgi:hypothetical protein
MSSPDFSNRRFLLFGPFQIPSLIATITPGEELNYHATSYIITSQCLVASSSSLNWDQVASWPPLMLQVFFVSFRQMRNQSIIHH